MPDAGDSDYEHIEVNVTRKIEIRLSPEELIQAATHPVGTLTGAATKAVDRAGQIKRLANQVKSYFTGPPKPPVP
jgi:hypothetical protein